VSEPVPAEPEGEILPRLVDLPRDSAVQMNATATAVLSVVRRWSGETVASGDWAEAARLRRVLRPMVATITRRRLSTESIADAQQAARIVDRTLGATIAAGIECGRVGPPASGYPSIRELTGGDPISPLYRLAELSDDEFEAACARSRAHGGACSLDSVIWAADAPADAPAPEPVVDEPPAPPREIDVRRVVGDALTEIYAAITPLGQLEPSDLDQVDAALAKDYARGLWDALVPVMGLHSALRARGRNA
jgi:hypothetical protein